VRRCPICQRGFDEDPIYELIGAEPKPRNVARQVIAYHSMRRRFDEIGCQALGRAHESAERR
jgi:hypothetical protein